jgi:hypothetical protein
MSDTEEDGRESSRSEHVSIDTVGTDDDSDRSVVTLHVPADTDRAKELYHTDATFRDVADTVIDSVMEERVYNTSKYTYVGFLYENAGDNIQIAAEQVGTH